MYNSNLHFHFIGIGGSGMSGIAEILLARGFRVSGSDLTSSFTCDRLLSLGAVIYYSHDASNLSHDTSLIVYSSAVGQDNPEIIEARKRGIPVVQRAEVLAELMSLKYGVAVAGSHGKTTTTSMLGWIMEQGGLDPTVVVGGQVKSFGSGGRAGLGEYLVAEADESDRSFLLYRPSIAIVTNVDLEHLSAYRDADDLYASFEQFIHSVPFYGLAVLCIDDPFLFTLSKRYERRKILYGLSNAADISAEIKALTTKGVEYTVLHSGKKIFDAHLAMLGRHFALNSLAAIAVALEFGIPERQIVEALASYPGVERRLESFGEISGITVFNDYGHHPVEIKATLTALSECFREKGRKLVVVFQPHRYSRTKECFDDFCNSFAFCDSLVMTEIYAAGEKPISGLSGQVLAEGIQKSIDRPSDVCFVKDLDEAILTACSIATNGDILLLLGAGSIGKQAGKVREHLEQRCHY
jgi:UDP-N-acetylmuramate--alanine ligase